MSNYTKRFYEKAGMVARGIDQAQVDRMIDILIDVSSKGGRSYALGVDGGIGHAGHEVNNF